jgi:hypothetical protein
MKKLITTRKLWQQLGSNKIYERHIKQRKNFICIESLLQRCQKKFDETKPAKHIHTKGLEENVYYSPEACLIFLKTKFAWAPMWTGILCKDNLTEYKRFSNAQIGSSFARLKAELRDRDKEIGIMPLKCGRAIRIADPINRVTNKTYNQVYHEID